MKKMIAALFTVAGLLASSIGAWAADTPEEFKAQGFITIGVKADSKPWGYLDSSGKNIGMDIELGNDIARRLGVTAKFVTVTSGTRIPFLEQGKIDMIIATMYDTEARRKVIRMVEPHYGSAGTALFAPKSNTFKTWDDIRGKTLCGVNGSNYNKPAQQEGANVIALSGLSETFAALKAGNCSAIIYGDLELAIQLSDPTWANYTMPLDSRDELPWSIGIRKGSKSDALNKFLSDTIANWHKTNYLIDVNKKYGLNPTKFLTQLQQKYK
jgi:polar amino acid transport system substrate-binding protein